MGTNMIFTILTILDKILSLIGMQEQSRREVKKKILEESLAYQKDFKNCARIRTEWQKLEDEIRRERNGKTTNQ